MRDSRSSDDDLHRSAEEGRMHQEPVELESERQRPQLQRPSAPNRSHQPSSDRQPRPSNSTRQQQGQPSASNPSRTASGAPSSAISRTTYASFPSQHSLQAPSTAPSQSSSQPHIQPRAFAPAPLPPASTASQKVRGYQNITSVEPAPKRPLWSLGSTLPRVRRLPAKPTKTAHPTPGSRSKIVQQPPTLLNMHPIRRGADDVTAAGTDTDADDCSGSPGGPDEPVYGHDFASATENERSTPGGVAGDDTDRQDLRISPTTSGSTNAGTDELPPIREGEPLPTEAAPKPAPTDTSSNLLALHARPRFDHAFSSPMVSDTAQIRVVGDDKLRMDSVTATSSRRPEQKNSASTKQARASSRLQNEDTSEPQQRLSAARKQLIEEAKHGAGLLASQESAVDAADYNEEDEAAANLKAAPGLHGVTSHPASKHIKTSSMPFLPSQGFDVLVAEPSHKGADQLHDEAVERKRIRAESQSRSAMDQTRHPGLSGARPTPKGRAAGGPAAGVGIRKPSTQSNRRASNATNEDRNAVGYFDDDVPLHELTHLDRQGSSRHRRGSQQSHQTQEEHVEPRPVGGRSSSHRSSNGRDTRSAWLNRSMPSHASRHRAEEGRSSSEEADAGRVSLQQAREQDDRTKAPVDRHSEETAYSASSDHQSGEAVQAGDQGADDGGQEWEEGQKSSEGEEDELWLGGQGTLADGSIAFPTTWARWRYHSREFSAELLATMLLITVGTAVDCQVTLSQSMGQSAGAYPNQNWAWGIAVASTIYLSGGRSGAHCNPAITLSLAVFRGFPWIQVPIYWSAQLLGSFLGAAITYGIYLPAIDHYEGGRDIRTLSGEHGTGRLFVTVPQLVFTAASGFGTEVVATSILMAMVLAVGDETNAPPSDGLSALVLGFVVVMIGMSFGWPTSYAISPSRDLGPRLFLYAVGYGKELWTDNSYWWLYGPQAGCFTGGLLGALLYDLAIFTGEESPINYTKQGWEQSTPARIGSRMLNSAERLEFWTNPLRWGKRGPNIGSDDNDGGSDTSPPDNGQGAFGSSRSENAVHDAKGASDGGVPCRFEPNA